MCGIDCVGGHTKSYTLNSYIQLFTLAASLGGCHSLVEHP